MILANFLSLAASRFTNQSFPCFYFMSELTSPLLSFSVSLFLSSREKQLSPYRGFSAYNNIN